MEASIREYEGTVAMEVDRKLKYKPNEVNIFKTLPYYAPPENETIWIVSTLNFFPRSGYIKTNVHLIF